MAKREPKQEYEAVVFTEGLNKEGWKVSPTIRGNDPLKALQDLEAIIAYMEEEGYIPYVSYYNKASENVSSGNVVPEPLPEPSLASEPYQDEGVVATAVGLGGQVVSQEPVYTPIEDGTMYLGVKASKMDDILENQSYEVLANCYSFDGKWVNFFNGSKPSAGHYFASNPGERLFKEMFPLWLPVLNADKSPIPTGPVKLYVVGVRSKDGKVYQNIKGVEPA